MRCSIWVASAIVVFVALAPRTADARKVVVMRAEGKVDSFTRKQLEYELLALARHVDPKATQVDFVFADAASVSNCTGDLEKCKGPVLEEFGVDEILVGTIDPAPDGTLQVTVRRATRGKTVQTVTMRAKPDTLGNEITAKAGPWYGVTATTPPASTPPPPAGGSKVPPPPATTTRPPPPTEDRTEPVLDPEPPPPSREAPPPPVASTPAASPAAPDDDRPRGAGRGYLGGIVGGGALVAVGIVLWTRAGSTQDEIDHAAVGTEAELRHVQDLEDTGHAYALWGNVSVIAGVVVAGTCGYLYWRAQRRASHSVAISPSVNAHGVGLILTIGGL